jgi:hypothetical protein
VPELGAGALAGFRVLFYSVGFDFHLGEKLLGDRRQLRPRLLRHTDEDPDNVVVKSLLTRDTFVAEHLNEHDSKAVDRNKGA